MSSLDPNTAISAKAGVSAEALGALSSQPLRLEYLDPATLQPHEKNWKIHPVEQVEALGALTREVGWAGALLYNESTGKLLDGHGRRELAIERGGSVPVLIGQWTVEQEEKILALLDPTGAMFRVDSSALDALLRENAGLDLLAESSTTIATLIESLRDYGDLVVTPSASDDETAKPEGRSGSASKSKRPAVGEVPDALWPSDNPWGIPLLDLALQADAVEFPVTAWGTQGQGKAMRGTWAFYVDDTTFSPLWSNPGKVLPSGAPCLIELNYSTHDQTPFAVALHAIYQKRWLARYWQSQGRRIFVDINIHHDLLCPHEAVGGRRPGLLGVPKGWRAFATRAHANRPEMLLAEYRYAREHSEVDSLLFLVYGGGKAVKDLCETHGWVWVPEQSDTARGKYLAEAGLVGGET